MFEVLVIDCICVPWNGLIVCWSDYNNAIGLDIDNVTWTIEQVTYPNMMEFFETLGVEMELSDMSFAVSLDNGRGCEWGSRNGLSGLFAQKRNLLNPYFWQMIREIVKFKDDVIRQVLACSVYTFIC